MVRLTRTHVPRGIYYTLLRSSGRAVLLSGEEDRVEFEKLLQRAIKRCKARVHAFCWTTHELHLALQVSDVPLGKIVQRVAGQYATQVLKRRGESGHLFLHPYRSVIIADNLLLDVVRHIHRAPLTAEMNGDVATYRWSSHRCYLGLESIPWLTTSTVMRMCAEAAETPVDGYRRLISDPKNQTLPTPQKHNPIFSSQSDGSSYIQWLTDKARPRRSTLSLTELAHAVAARLGVDPDAVLSPSRQRKLSLARSLTAWHATRNDITTLSAVARFLGRDPSTLISGMTRYQVELPRLFAEALPKMIKRNKRAEARRGNAAAINRRGIGDRNRLH